MEGTFEDAAGRTVTWKAIEVHDYQGDIHTGSDMEEALRTADQVFYEMEVGDESFFRWVAGPFETEGDLEAAIGDEADFYSETT